MTKNSFRSRDAHSEDTKTHSDFFLFQALYCNVDVCNLSTRSKMFFLECRITDFLSYNVYDKKYIKLIL